MARQLELTADVIAAIRRRRKDGATYPMLVTEFGLSKGSIGRALSRTPAKRKTQDTATAAPGEALEPMVDMSDDSDDVLTAARALVARAEDGEPEALEALRRAVDVEVADALATVRRCLGMADRMLRRMPKDDVASFATLTRLSTAAAIAIGRLTPPKAENPDDSPDMKSAAARARDKLREYVTRLAGGEALGAEPSPAQLFAAALAERGGA